MTKLPRWFPLVAIVLGILIVSAVIVLLITSPKQEQLSDEDREFLENSRDITEFDETLSDQLMAATQKDAYKDYQTELNYTKFATLTAEEFCNTINISCSNILSKNLTKITTLSPNILNYYLDNDYIVIISSGSSSTIIFGAVHSTPVYLTFSPSDKDFDEYNYVSKVDLFNPLTGSETFSVFKP